MIALLKCLAISLAFFLLMALSIFLLAGALLSWPASAPEKADLVVALGGGNASVRYNRAADIVEAGFAKRLLLIHPTNSILRNAQGRFGRDNVLVDNRPDSSWQEALVTKEAMVAHGWQRALVVSDPPHMLRLHYTWSSILNEAGMSFGLAATQPGWWSAWLWWNDRRAIEFVGSEWVKLVYYVVRYRFGLGEDWGGGLEREIKTAGASGFI